MGIMSTTAELRQLLKEDSQGKNLYDHLTETLMKILIDKPKDAYDSFELISANVKSNPLNPDPEQGKPRPLDSQQLQKQLDWTKSCEVLLKKPDEPVEAEVKYPDICSEANALEWAGVSVGKAESYRLYLSIKKFSETCSPAAVSLRFFGKIFTRGLPYYVIEGENPDEPEEIDNMKQEGKEGANKYAYWVSQSTTSVDKEWVKLPDVTMAQIVAARKFKKFLTGDLDAPVCSFPPFEGTEKNLLRAQIARVAGSTSISPDGYYIATEDEPPALGEATEDQPYTGLTEPEAWKHHVIPLNKIGRVTQLPEVLDENGDPITPEEEIEVNVLLDGIKPQNWTFRTCPGGAGSSPITSVVVARSLEWPGAVAVSYGRKYVNIYVGYLISNDNVSRNEENPQLMTYTPYSPPMPSLIQSEWVQPSEEDGGLRLLEEADTKEDPTPPVKEGEGEDE